MLESRTENHAPVVAEGFLTAIAVRNALSELPSGLLRTFVLYSRNVIQQDISEFSHTHKNVKENL
jgi:hypothetical protein